LHNVLPARDPELAEEPIAVVFNTALLHTRFDHLPLKRLARASVRSWSLSIIDEKPTTSAARRSTFFPFGAARRSPARAAIARRTRLAFKLDEKWLVKSGASHSWVLQLWDHRQHGIMSAH
jgi:hypothetical protein